ncbi:hypothetical protein QF026_007170 [Streptomyces aurantiacus]|nr:hypothetical protein [Streptomyces aurantiacus]
MRSSLVPARSCPDPAPSSPSRKVTVPSQELSWNTRCVAASATTICTGMVRYSGSSPGPKACPGSVFHSRYVPSRSRGPDARPPRPKKRASAATSDRCIQRARPPPAGSHHRGGRSRRRLTPPGVSTSTAPNRETTTVIRSATTRQAPSLSGSSTARQSGSGAPSASAYEGSGPAPSQAQKTAPPVVTVMRSSERVNRTTPPPGVGSADSTGPGTRARSGPRAGSPAASARLLRHAARTVSKPWPAPAEPTAFIERTRSRPFMLLSLPPEWAYE